MPSPEFLELVRQMEEIHIRKSADYATDNAHSNFEFTAELVQHFKNPIDQVFVTLIGIKLARLSVLLNSGKTPENESVADTFIDLPNYCALWGSYYMKENKK